jgi:hypothetical protein
LFRFRQPKMFLLFVCSWPLDHCYLILDSLNYWIRQQNWGGFRFLEFSFLVSWRSVVEVATDLDSIVLELCTSFFSFRNDVNCLRLVDFRGFLQFFTQWSKLPHRRHFTTLQSFRWCPSTLETCDGVISSSFFKLDDVSVFRGSCGLRWCEAIAVLARQLSDSCVRLLCSVLQPLLWSFHGAFEGWLPCSANSISPPPLTATGRQPTRKGGLRLFKRRRVDRDGMVDPLASGDFPSAWVRP